MSLCFTKTGNEYISTVTVGGNLAVLSVSTLDWSLTVTYDGVSTTYTGDVTVSPIWKIIYTGVALGIVTYTITFTRDTSCCNTSSSSSSASASASSQASHSSSVPGGSLSPCSVCPSGYVATEFVVDAALTNADCSGCVSFNGAVFSFFEDRGTACRWQSGAHTFCETGVSAYFEVDTLGNVLSVIKGATYTGTWSCSGPITLTLASTSDTSCGYPGTITFTPI